MIVYKQIGDKRIAYLSPHMGLRRAPDMKPRMDSELQGILDRADELTEEFRKEFERCIENMSVTERAKNIFHEVLIKLRSALDITMSRVWSKYVSPDWPQQKEKPKIYFPIRDDQQSFEDEMKRYGMQNLQTLNEDLYNLIVKAQPFVSEKKTLSDFRSMANLGKHTGFVLQKLESKEAIKITSPKGTMIYTKGTEFPSSQIMGASVDPKTQRVIPTSEVKDEEIVWVQCSLDDYGYDPLIFCLTLCQDIRGFLQKMSKFL